MVPEFFGWEHGPDFEHGDRINGASLISRVITIVEGV